MEINMNQKKKHKHSNRWDSTFDILNIVFMVLFVMLVVFPLLNLFSLAFSNGIENTNITFFPRALTFQSFEFIFSNKEFSRALLNSIILTVSITVLSNMIMAMAAYCLSKSDFPFRKFFLIFFIITMLFSAGIVPSFLLLHLLRLTNTLWSLILISISNVFNMLLFKTFFEALPEDIEEAAKIDGVGGFAMFINIVIPMSLPVIASCCFFTIVGVWNSYSGAIMFLPDNAAAEPLALYIYRLISGPEPTDEFLVTNGRNVISATIVLSIVPIIAIYPFVIRYIKSGLTVGSVKG